MSEEAFGDVVRSLILGQIVVVAALYLHALARAVCSLSKFEGSARALMVGRVYRIVGVLACAIFLAGTAITRMGHPVSLWRSTLAEVAIVCFAEAWRRLDFVNYRPRTGRRAGDL